MPDSSTVYSVYQVNMIARQVLESYSFWVRGEVSNASPDKYAFKYFKLKDEQGTIDCIFLSSKLANLDFKIEDGISITVFGTLSVFERDGKFQLKVEVIKKEGVGDLQTKVEEIKNKLQKEGLLDSTRKRPLKPIPNKIGIITSSDSAAWKDFYKIINERYPNVELFIYDVLVQGDKAPGQIIKAISYFNSRSDIDLLVITRGGGSLEDLMAFNDEALARAIASSNHPTVCAIGHEKDVSIAELVADLRASTPSNAAELIVPNKEALYQMLDIVDQSLQKWILRKLEIYESDLLTITQRSSLMSKDKFIRIYEDQLYRIGEKLAAKNILFEKMDHVLTTFQVKIGNATKEILAKNTETVNALDYQLKCAADMMIELLERRLENYAMKLEKFDPKSILEKGYTLTVTNDGKAIKKIADIKKGDIIATYLSDGKIQSSILTINQNE